MLSRKLSAASILWALSLNSCVSRPPHPEADWQNGAKRAWIVKFYSAASPDASLPECLATLTKTELATGHFVKVEYRHTRKKVSTIAELPNTLRAKIHDQVEIWPEDCSRGKVSRVSRLLSSVSE